MFGRDGGEAGFADQMRRKPGGIGREGGIGKVRPVVTQGLAEEGGAGAQGFLILAPRKGFGALEGGIGQQFRGGLEIGHRGGVVGKAQRVDAALAAGANGPGGGVESETGFGGDMASEQGFEFGWVEPCG